MLTPSSCPSAADDGTAARESPQAATDRQCGRTQHARAQRPDDARLRGLEPPVPVGRLVDEQVRHGPRLAEARLQQLLRVDQLIITAQAGPAFAEGDLDPLAVVVQVTL